MLSPFVCAAPKWRTRLLAAQVERHAIAVGRVRHPGPLLVAPKIAALHLVEEAGPIVFVSDLEHIAVGQVPLAERVMEWRRHEVTNRLLDDIGDRALCRARDRLGLQSVEHQHAFIRRDDTAVERPAGAS